MKKLLSSEAFRYLSFGVLTTLVYMGMRLVIFALTQSTATSAVIASITAIVSAFFTNDCLVFNQVRAGWSNRFIKFFITRPSALTLDLILAYLLVTKFPYIIGQFVSNNISLVNMTKTVSSQVLTIVLNYAFSKLLIFKDRK